MKNEIGRKLTSLTIMAIMFAGGMAIGVPSFMPEAASDLSVTDGLLTVSNTNVQGAAVVEVVVNDPGSSNTSDDMQKLFVSWDGNDYDMTQGSDGKWYLYLVDASSASSVDDDGTGWEFGILCTSGLDTEENGSTGGYIVGTSTDVYAAVSSFPVGTESNGQGNCLDADGADGTTDTATSTARQNLTANILANAPSLSNPDGDDANNGQRVHKLNATSGYGSWPYVVSVEFSDSNDVEFGSDVVTVEYGNTDDLTSISLADKNPAGGKEVHLTIVDPALNIDPTTADIWIFDLDKTDTDTTVIFGTNGTNTAMSPTQLGSIGCVQNCQLTSDGEASLASGTSGTGGDTSDGTVSAVQMRETGANTGVFESFVSTGEAEFETLRGTAADARTIFSYGGNTEDMIITYYDASLSIDGTADWVPGSSATITVTDPDANTNPLSAETLSIGDPHVVIPTIKMGSPKTLAGGQNEALSTAVSTPVDSTTGVNVGEGSPGTEGASDFTFTVYNTSDNSERLRILNSASPGNTAVMTSTWLNVTTGHTRADLVNLAGSVVLSYDITGPAASMSSTDINVWVTESGNNGTDSGTGAIDVITSGNVRAGVYDLCGSAGFGCLADESVTAKASNTFGSERGNAGTSLVSIAFEITHAAGNQLTDTEDYAIAADFCNFDQNNGSLTHNCIYRLEAVETGDDTGVFEGTVEYINMVNSSNVGGHYGGNAQVEGLLGYVTGDALSVVLMDAVSGSDAVRVLYNDTDSAQQATTVASGNIATSTHTGTIAYDALNYGAGDVATLTIVDPDLNQDSSSRDTYTNSTTTFSVKIYKSGSTTATEPFASSMTIVETGDNSGVFVGTFVVPDRKGADMKVTLYEAKTAGSSVVTYEENATISSTTGSIALDRSVYPVPFTSGTLNTGAGTASVNTEGGAVTAWITVEDPDESNTTMTAGGASEGTIKINHVEGTDTSECFTAGGNASYSASSGLAAELGPLAEVEIGSSVYEVSFSITKTIICDDETITVQSGDVLQASFKDTSDSSGLTSTVFDSATFDLRTGSLSVDKDVYVMGSDMVITLTDPDLNLDSTSSESYAMSLIQWDSAADNNNLLATSTADNTHTYFSHNPSSLEETGDNTGVFQTVTTLPAKTISSGNDPEYGEVVTLTYQDVGISGEDDVDDDQVDIETTFSISNFGALIELDRAVYGWTDTVYVTITAPDHNNNTAAEETIGTSTLPIQVTSRQGKMCDGVGTNSAYGIGAESGVDTGVFTMEILLTGYSLATANNNPGTTTNVCSSTDSAAGKLRMAGQTDGISVSYEYTNNVVVVASASVMFNIAEASWDTSSASAGGSATLTVTDADENINGDIINTFTVAVFSDSDNGGFTLTMNETDEDTGVFEGTVNFTSDAATSGINLRVAEGDTVTAEFSDVTLPEPYTDSDSLTLASTLTIGTAFPPLERAPAANARVVDAFGASVAEVSVDQQVQIAADVSNGQSGDQAFAYLVQVQDESGVTVSLAWITGSLTASQSMSPALSWTPSASGSYTATVFVWESVDNPTALSPTVSVSIDVV